MLDIGVQASANDLRTYNAIDRAKSILDTAMEQLSTMSRINHGRDDPAGLIAMEELNAELRSMQQAHANASRANGMLNVADSGMMQVNSLLNTINENIVAAGNSFISEGERAALQMEVDAAVEAIDRIGRGTKYGGRSLLDGSAGFQIEGVDTSQVLSVDVYQNVGGGERTLDINVVTSAQAAEISMAGADFSGGGTISLRTNDGSGSVTFAAGSSLEDAAEAINSQSELTGVTARIEDSELILQGAGVGSDAYLDFEVVAGDLNVQDAHATGTDVEALVNGQAATGDGNTIRIQTSAMQADVTLAEGVEGQLDEITIRGNAITLTVTPDVGRVVQVGLPNVSSTALGGQAGRLSDLTTGGALSLSSGNLGDAQSVVADARSTVLGYQARVGSFQKYSIESSQRVLEDTMVSVADALSYYDTDVAVATSNLARGDILMQAGIQAALFNNRNRMMALNLLSENGSFINGSNWW